MAIFPGLWRVLAGGLFVAMAGQVQGEPPREGQTDPLVIGQCRHQGRLPAFVKAVTEGCYVDVTTDPIAIPAGHDEVTILKDFDFDALGINFVTAIEQIYPVSCDGNCTNLKNNRRPWECTNGITDVLLQAFESKANFNEQTRLFPVVFGDAAEPLFVSVVLHPSDTAFAYRSESGPLKNAHLKLGSRAGSRLRVGTLAARILMSEQAERIVQPITMRFHTLCEAPRRSEPNTAFLIAVNFLDPQPDFLQFSKDLQVRTNRVSRTNVENLITVANEVEAIRFLQLGIVGHHWLTGTRLEVKRKNGKLEKLNTVRNYNFYGTTLPRSDLELRKGDELRFICEFNDTANPRMDFFPGNYPDGVIPIGPKIVSGSVCAIQGIYGKAACDSQFVESFRDGGELLAFDCNPGSKGTGR